MKLFAGTNVFVLDSCVRGVATACRVQLYDVVCLPKLIFVMHLFLGLKTVMGLAVTAARDFHTPGWVIGWVGGCSCRDHDEL